MMELSRAPQSAPQANAAAARRGSGWHPMAMFLGAVVWLYAIIGYVLYLAVAAIF